MNTSGTKFIPAIILFATVLCAASAAQSTPDSSTQQPQQPASSAPASTPPAQAAPASDQKPPDAGSKNDDALTTIRTRSDEVNVVFTVTDKKGRRITDLKQNDFRVVD